MTQERAPESEQSLVGDESETTSWDLARERLANPEDSRTSWLATTRPDGRPHLMPVIAFWIDGAMHMVVGEGTRKGRNLSADGHASWPRAARRSHRSTSSSRAVPRRSRRTTTSDTWQRSSMRRAGRSRPRATRSSVRTRPQPDRRPTRSSGSSRRRCSASPACSAWNSSILRSCRDRPAGTSKTEERSARGRWCQRLGALLDEAFIEQAEGHR